MDSTESTDPGEAVEGYADAAPIYRERGWESPFPLPRGKKFPPPKGATGREGRTPNPQQITAWRRKHPDSNTGLRLADGVIGIDVDGYGDKLGGRTLAEAERRWGMLPPTVVSSSRDDRVSGIRLYRTPEGIELPGDIKLTLGDGTVVGDIEIIQRHHRYVVAWPSLHPSGRRYLWVDADWNPLPSPPRGDELPWLPEKWLGGLAAAHASSRPNTTVDAEKVSGGQNNGQTAVTDRHSAEFDAAVAEALTEGTMGPLVRDRFTRAADDCAGPSRYETARNHTLALLRYGSQGEPGVRTALLALREVYGDAVAGDRDGGRATAIKEFNRHITDAGRLLAGGLDSVDFNPDDATGEHQAPSGEPSSGWKTTRFSEVEMRSVEWVWEGYLPRGKLAMLDGDPKLGKSSAAMDWAGTLTSGGEWPDGTRCTEAADVLFIGTEDGLDDTLAPRAKAAGADMDRLHYVQGTPDPKDPDVLLPPTLDEITNMRKVIEQHGIRLVIVDVLMAHLGSKVDSHKDQDIRRVLSPLAKMADETGCAVLLLRHLNKNKGGSALYRGSGSIGIGGAARSLLLVTLDPDDHNCRILSSPGGNLGALPTPLRFRIEGCEIDNIGVKTSRVEWMGPADYTADELLGEIGGHDDSPDPNAAEAWLEDFLTDAGKTLGTTVKDEAAKVGISARTLQRAAKKLKVLYRLEGCPAQGQPRLSYWELRGGTPLDDNMEPITPVFRREPRTSDLPDDADSIKVWLADYLTINGKTPRKKVLDAAVKAGVSRNTKGGADELDATAQELDVRITKDDTPRVDHWELLGDDTASNPSAEVEQ